MQNSTFYRSTFLIKKILFFATFFKTLCLIEYIPLFAIFFTEGKYGTNLRRLNVY